jgi:prepilin-type N-terminal cleavage/methylation domain-containing protein
MMYANDTPCLAGGPCPPFPCGISRQATAGKARRLNRTRRGFSFVELLFAIMILGIGFIMIAAIFPVAIKQTAASGEETVASTIAKGAVGVIQQNVSNVLMPGTNKVIVPIGPTLPTGEDAGYGTAAANLWAAISGNMILPSDNRYAWAAMYERDGYAAGTTPPYAEVIVIGLQVRNRTQYTNSTPGQTNIYGDVGFAPAASLPSQPNLEPKQVHCSFTNNGGTTPDTVTFITDTPIETENAKAVAEGTYLILSNDNPNNVSPNPNVTVNYTSSVTTSNGTIYRIGNPSTTLANTWELLPGNDLYTQQGAPVVPNNGAQVDALIVGRSIHDPSQAYGASNPYEGLSQDISVYVTFVRINN